MAIKPFLVRHALVLYFVMAYSITWLLLPALVGGAVVAGQALVFADIVFMFVAMLAGPSTAGLVMTAVVGGRAGLGELWMRCRRWQVPMRWYAVAILTLPTVTLVTLGALALFVSPSFAPGFMLIGFMFGLIAGLFEEIGWSGFALPSMLRRLNPLAAGLLLGVLWAIWHGMADFLGNAQTMGALWPINFVVFWLLPLTAYRVLMVWVYNNTRSVLLMQLMHAFYTGTLLVLSPSVALEPSLTWKALFTTLLCAVTIGVVVATRGRLGCREPDAGKLAINLGVAAS